MKRLILLFVIVPFMVQAQDITGQWNGLLKVQGMELRLVFYISKEDATYHAKMDSSDQKAFGMPASATNFKDSTFDIEIVKAGIRYHGQYVSKGIEGVYQSGQFFLLNLTRNLIEKPHKLFLVLEDCLTRHGIAVLRYDDRGFAPSTGKHGAATSADFANDVRAAIAYLNTRKEIDKGCIGLIGHGEGGLLQEISLRV